VASRTVALLAALAALGCAARAVPVPGALAVEVGFEDREAVLAPLAPVPFEDAARKDRLLELFRRAGCAGVEEHPPRVFDGYNSTSFIAGIVGATGGIPSIPLGGFVGGGIPIPREYFRPGQ
jgi:hypothetical protein